MTQIYSILGGLYKDEKSAPAMALLNFFQVQKINPH